MSAARLLQFDREESNVTGGDKWLRSRPDKTDMSSAAEPALVAPDQPTHHPASCRTIQVLDLGSPSLRLAQPLPVALEECGGAVVARSYDLDLFEEGDTDGEALDALRSAIVELYTALLEMTPRSAYLDRKFAFLESIRQRCP